MQLQRVSYAPGVGWSPWDASLDGDRTLAIVFGSPALDVGPALGELARAFPRAVKIGCSTAGEIHQARVLDGTLCAAILRFEHTALRVAHAPVAAASRRQPSSREIAGGTAGSAGSREAGQAIGRALAGDELRAVLVLSDGLAVNGSALAAGIGEAIGPGPVVTGGLAADGERFGATWVLHEGAVRDGLVTAVGLYGKRLRVGHGSQGGWDLFGPERVVTRADGNILYELDGKPALALYKEYLGDRARGLPAMALLFPLAVRPPGERGRWLVRTVLAIDEATQSMRFAGDVPQGAISQLMKANFDRLVTGASDAAAAAAGVGGRAAAGDAGPVLAIAISCFGRRLVLKGRIEEETEAALDALPPGTQQIGFYSYGELSPASGGGCDLHNQTMTLTTICEP